MAAATRSSLVLAHLALAIAQVFFGCLNVVLKVALNADASPFIFGLYRDCLALPLFLTLATLRKEWRPCSSIRDGIQFALAGLVGIYGNQLLCILGIKMTNADLAGFYQPLAPIFTTVLAVCPFRYEKANLRKAVGVAVGVGGVALLVIPSAHAVGTGSSDYSFIVGNLFLVGNSLSASLYFLLLKPLYGRYPCHMISAIVYGVSTIALLLTCSVFIGRSVWSLAGLTEVWALLYAGLLCSFLSYLLMTWGNEFVDASMSCCYVLLQPVASCILAYFALGEPVSWLDSFGSLFSLVGLALVGTESTPQVHIGPAGSSQILVPDRVDDSKTDNIPSTPQDECAV